MFAEPVTTAEASEARFTLFEVVVFGRGATDKLGGR
jgi:hypothetical protein